MSDAKLTSIDRMPDTSVPVSTACTVTVSDWSAADVSMWAGATSMDWIAGDTVSPAAWATTNVRVVAGRALSWAAVVVRDATVASRSAVLHTSTLVTV